MPRKSDSPVQRVILVEDDEDLRSGLADYLRLCNFIVDETGSGKNFFEALHRQIYDVVILDVNLPDVSGFDLARFMAARGDSGIIVLTARVGRQDRVRGYQVGADLYLTKPADSEEVALAAWNLGLRIRRQRSDAEARIGPLVRKPVLDGLAQAGTDGAVSHGHEPAHVERPPSDPGHESWILHRAGQILRCPNGTAVPVSGKEALLLERLAVQVGKIVPRNSLAEIYEADFMPAESRKLDVAISRLRRKIGNSGTQLPVQIIRSSGIRLLEPILIA